MGFFKSLFTALSASDELVTWIVELTQENLWKSHGIELDSDLDPTQSLNEVVKSLYDKTVALKPTVTEVQFAIYPWAGKISHVYSVELKDSIYKVIDQNSTEIVSADSLDNLVAAANSKIVEPPKVMLQYVIPVQTAEVSDDNSNPKLT